MDKKEKQHTLLLTLAALIATLVVVAAVVTAWHQSDDPADQPKHQISAVKHHADTVRDTVPRVVTQRVVETREVNVMHWWQRTLMWAGVLLIAAALAALILIIKRRM